MGELPSHDLELKAANERRELHTRLAELRAHVHQELDLKKHARERLGAACTLLALASFGLGYAITGFFVRH
jgi:hypothetical protein